MKRKVIAIEPDLGPMVDLLRAEGYELVEMKDIDRADGIITNGQTRNSLGIHNTTTTAPVIDMEGRTPEEVLDALRERFELQE